MLIQIPTDCPSCGSKLRNINGQLFCDNKTGCSAQSSKLVENFCKKMKIKGFGAKTIDKLDLQTISGLYNLTEQRLKDVLGDKVGTKLFSEIQSSYSKDFATVLSSLGINLIGQVAANKLATKINGFSQITTQTCKDAGLGDKATDSLISWIRSAEGQETVLTLAGLFDFKQEVKNVETPATNVDVCITGKLEDFASRTKATEYLSQYGINVKKSITKSVQYLICEDDSKTNSSSYKKAVNNNLPILTIKQLIKIIGEK